MPRAPSYNPNQVGPVETTGARFRTPDFGPPAVAQGLAGFGKAVNDFAVEEDQRDAEFDDTQSRKLATNALTELQGITNEYTSLQGGNATAARKSIDERLAKVREAALGQTANERQKRMLGERLDGLFGSAMGTIDKHYRSEEFTERLGTIATESAQLADSAAMTDDADASAAYLAQGKATFQDGLRLRGVTDPEAVAFETLKFTDGAHTAKIDRWFASPNPDIDLIASYVEAHSDEMTTSGYAKAIGRLQGPLQDRSDYADFERVVAGPMPPSEPGKPGTGFTKVATDIASRFGLSPVDVASVISYETGGTFSSTVMGGKNGQYMGLIQFGPSERAKYGITAKSSPEQWSTAVGNFLEDRGFKKGMGVLDLYSTINAGSPGRYNASDGNGTVRSHTEKILSEHRVGAEKWLAGGGVTEAPRAWDKDIAYNQIDEAAEREGWSFEKTNRVKAWADKQIARDEQLLGRERAAADEAAFSTVNSLGEGFTSISQLPASVRANLSPADVAKYDNIAKANAAPKAVPANGPAAFALDALEMADPNAFASADLSKFFADLTPAERSSYMLRQQKVKDGLKGWTPYTGINGAVTRATNFGGFKLDDGQKLAVRQIMQAEADRRFKATGKPLNDVEFDDIFRTATRDVPTHKWYGAKGSVKWYDQTVANIGDETRKRIVDAYKTTFGVEPNDEQIMTWYRRNFIPARAQ